MAWRGVCSIGLAVMVSGCGRGPVGSPFAGSGASGVGGVLAVFKLGPADLRARLPQAGRHLVPAGLGLVGFVLDPLSFDSALAFAFAGADPDLAVGACELLGLLTPEAEAGVYSSSLAQQIMGELLPQPGSGPLARVLGGLGPARSASSVRLKRFDRGERTLLAPSVDVRDVLLDLSEQVDATLPPDTRFAIALDGPQLARVVGQQLTGSLNLFGSLAGMASARVDTNARRLLTLAQAGVQGSIDLLDSLQGAVLRIGAHGLDARLTVRDESIGAAMLGCLRHPDGLLPRSAPSDQAAFEACLALDLPRLVALVEGRAAHWQLRSGIAADDLHHTLTELRAALDGRLAFSTSGWLAAGLLDRQRADRWLEGDVALRGTISHVGDWWVVGNSPALQVERSVAPGALAVLTGLDPSVEGALTRRGNCISVTMAW